MSSITKRLKKLEEQGHDVWKSGSATTDSVRAIEKALQVTLPESYKNFLLECGALYIGNSALNGTMAEPLSEDGGMVYYETRQARQSFSLEQHLVVIHQDSDEWYVCLDTSRLHNGECPIVEADRNTGKVKGKDLYKNFEEYLECFLGSQHF